jgi:hypothetical protein
MPENILLYGEFERVTREGSSFPNGNSLISAPSIQITLP